MEQEKSLIVLPEVNIEELGRQLLDDPAFVAGIVGNVNLESNSLLITPPVAPGDPTTIEIDITGTGGITVSQTSTGSWLVDGSVAQEEIDDGKGVTVSGTGIPADPFRPNLNLTSTSLEIVQAINNGDPTTIDIEIDDGKGVTVTGTGSTADPFRPNLNVTSDSLQIVQALNNGDPTTIDIDIVGTGAATVVESPQGVYTVNVPTPPAATVVDDGIGVTVSGTGTIADPIRPNLNITSTSLLITPGLANGDPTAIDITITGSGAATVTQSPQGTYDVNVPAAPAAVVVDDGLGTDVVGNGSVATPYRPNLLLTSTTLNVAAAPSNGSPATVNIAFGITSGGITATHVGSAWNLVITDAVPHIVDLALYMDPAQSWSITLGPNSSTNIVLQSASRYKQVAVTGPLKAFANFVSTIPVSITFTNTGAVSYSYLGFTTGVVSGAGPLQPEPPFQHVAMELFINGVLTGVSVNMGQYTGLPAFDQGMRIEFENGVTVAPGGTVRIEPFAFGYASAPQASDCSIM